MQTGSLAFFIAENGRSIILDVGNVGTICRQKTARYQFWSQAYTAWPPFTPLSIDGTPAAFKIQHFTRDIGIVNFPFKFDLFITTASTTLAFGLPLFNSHQNTPLSTPNRKTSDPLYKTSMKLIFQLTNFLHMHNNATL